MSAEGIKKAAEVFDLMQRIRFDLIEMAGKPGVVNTPSGHQDLALATLLENGKEFMKDRFGKIVMEG